RTTTAGTFRTAGGTESVGTGTTGNGSQRNSRSSTGSTTTIRGHLSVADASGVQSRFPVPTGSPPLYPRISACSIDEVELASTTSEIPAIHDHTVEDLQERLLHPPPLFRNSDALLTTDEEDDVSLCNPFDDEDEAVEHHKIENGNARLEAQTGEGVVKNLNSSASHESREGRLEAQEEGKGLAAGFNSFSSSAAKSVETSSPSTKPELCFRRFLDFGSEGVVNNSQLGSKRISFLVFVLGFLCARQAALLSDVHEEKLFVILQQSLQQDLATLGGPTINAHANTITLPSQLTLAPATGYFNFVLLLPVLIECLLATDGKRWSRAVLIAALGLLSVNAFMWLPWFKWFYGDSVIQTAATFNVELGDEVPLSARLLSYIDPAVVHRHAELLTGVDGSSSQDSGIKTKEVIRKTLEAVVAHGVAKRRVDAYLNIFAWQCWSFLERPASQRTLPSSNERSTQAKFVSFVRRPESLYARWQRGA
ncbi:unnamed protein product, partial [Amoebophrya sp. A25]